MAGKSTIVEFIELPKLIDIQKRPGKRAKARIYCVQCSRHHHLHWGELQNALKRGADSLQEVIAQYSFKYCVKRRYNKFL
jgi:hypothetical protein